MAENPTTYPDPLRAEPVQQKSYDITSAAKVVAPYSVQIQLIVPASTVAKLKNGTEAGDSYVTLSEGFYTFCANGQRAFENAFEVSRDSGSGTINLIVQRVTGRTPSNSSYA